ncbi:hypothetical protein D9M68_647400 [compost metagenome]
MNFVAGGGSKGKDLYEIRVTGKVIDDTGKGLSDKQLNRHQKAIISGIEDSFSGKGDGIEWKATTEIEIAKTDSDLAKGNHAFRLKGQIGCSGETGNDPTLQIAESTSPFQNVVNLSVSAFGNFSRTAAHELGHSAGLAHIKDDYMPYKGGIKSLSASDYPNNLMQQYRDVSNPGNTLQPY